MAAQQIGPTLSDIAYGSRLFIKYGAILLAFFMIGRILLNFGVSVYKALNPPKLPPPTLGFGTLPTLEFGPDLSSPKEYLLQTVTGGLPNLGEQVKVFFVPENKASLLAVDHAQKQAAALGFVFPYEQISQTILRWRKTNPLPATLEIDVVTGDATMKVDWASNPSFFVDSTLPSETTATVQAKSILKQADLLPADMATGAANISYLRAAGAEYLPAPSYSEADFIQVDLFRTPVDTRFRILGPQADKGNARIILSGSKQDDQKVVGVEYRHRDVEYDRFETYPLISTAQAWNMLQSGQGHIASVSTPETAQVVVRNVVLGYFDPQPGQLYMQPIYIFIGDNGFMGYVPAASSTPPQKN